MKKTIAILTSLLLALTAVSCKPSDTKNSDTSDEINHSSDKNDSGSIQVDKSLFSVDITLPAIFFTDLDEEKIQNEATENGYENYVINKDGSITYTMSKKKYNEMLSEFKNGLEETISELTEGSDAIESFISIEYKDDFSEINVLVDGEKYSQWDNFQAIVFYINGGYYQAFSGVAAEDIDVIVNYIDATTQDILFSGSFLDYSNSEDFEDEDFIDEDYDLNQDEDIKIEDIFLISAEENVEQADLFEFYIEYVNITEDVLPPKPDSWYSHYEAGDGRRYVDLCIAYKNLSTQDQIADEVMDATLQYAGQYVYTGFSIIEEDNRSDFTYSSTTGISPLSTEYLHYLFEVPDSVELSEGSLEIIISMSGTKYRNIVREGSHGEVDRLDPKAVAITSGDVEDGQIIAIKDNCEFYVDFAEIVDEVLPPNPDDWHTYYEADNGKAYVDFCVAYKNWQKKDVIAEDVMTATLTYSGKYEYKGFSIIEEENRSDFTYANITGISPLTTEYLHYLFEVPAELATTESPVSIEFEIGGNTYNYSLR